MNPQDRLTIIIVNWNTGRLLNECLLSIARLPDLEKVAEVIVVDNNSSDTSFTEAKKIELPVPSMFMGLPQNIGFAAANNMAMRRRRHKDTHVLLLNPDTQVYPHALTAMLSELTANKKVGIVGPKLLEKDGSIQPSVRAFPRFATLIFFFLKLQRIFPQSNTVKQYVLPDFDYSVRQEVDQVMGAAFLIRNTLLQEIGLLDETFWVWFEEVDFCKRAKDAGWLVVYTPAGSVMHYGGTSFHQLVGFKKILPLLHSTLHYAHTYFPWYGYVFLLLLWPLAAFLSLPVSLFHFIVRMKNKTRL